MKITSCKGESGLLSAERLTTGQVLRSSRTETSSRVTFGTAPWEAVAVMITCATPAAAPGELCATALALQNANSARTAEVGTARANRRFIKDSVKSAFRTFW